MLLESLTFGNLMMRTVTTDQRLGLAPHVRACASDGQVILLDLKKSAYLGIGQCSALANRVVGWPRTVAAVRDDISFEATERTLLGLLERGLLTDVLSIPSRQATAPDPTSSFDPEDGAPKPDIGGGRMARFVKSAVQTSVWMRCRSLQAIAMAVQSRRDRLQSTSTKDSPASITAATAAYDRLRPFAFSAYRNCLYDSLALTAFLASEGAFPRWVIGVKTRPFGAHSWVQMGETVLNDQHEMVRQFRPILVV